MQRQDSTDPEQDNFVVYSRSAPSYGAESFSSDDDGDEDSDVRVIYNEQCYYL